MLKSILILAAIIAASAAQAIVNIESVRPKQEDTGYKGQAKVDFNGSSGNSEKFRGGLAHSSVWNSGISQQFLLLSYKYGESQKVRETNESFVHLRYVQPIYDSTLWELYSQSQTNEFKRLTVRALLGVGGRWEFQDKESFSQAFGAGLFYSHEELAVKGLIPAETEDTARGNFYFTLRSAVHEGLSALLSIYYQPKFEDWDDFHAFVSGMLKLDWTDSIAFAVEAELAHDNRPPLTVKKTDTTYATSLIYKFE